MFRMYNGSAARKQFERTVAAAEASKATSNANTFALAMLVPYLAGWTGAMTLILC